MFLFSVVSTKTRKTGTVTMIDDEVFRRRNRNCLFLWNAWRTDQRTDRRMDRWMDRRTKPFTEIGGKHLVYPVSCGSLKDRRTDGLMDWLMNRLMDLWTDKWMYMPSYGDEMTHLKMYNPGTQGGQAKPELYAIFFLHWFVFLPLLLFLYIYLRYIFLTLIIRPFISKCANRKFHRI